jgi:hypothetical protein
MTEKVRQPLPAAGAEEQDPVLDDFVADRADDPNLVAVAVGFVEVGHDLERFAALRGFSPVDRRHVHGPIFALGLHPPRPSFRRPLCQRPCALARAVPLRRR